MITSAAMGLVEHDVLRLFTTTFRKFKLDESLNNRFAIHDISAKTIPLDFPRNIFLFLRIFGMLTLSFFN